MSEERFERIERRLDRLEAGQEALRADVAVLKSDVAVLKSDVAVLKSDVAVLKSDVAILKSDVAGLKGDVTSLKTGQDDLRRHMLVLHEQVIDAIRAIPDPMPQIERLLDRRLGDLREEIGRRLDPLETAVRWLVARSSGPAPPPAGPANW